MSALRLGRDRSLLYSHDRVLTFYRYRLLQPYVRQAKFIHRMDAILA